MTTSTTSTSVRLGWTIVYVPDVTASIEFYEQAFGLSRRFIADDGSYGELDTGSTTLSFSAYSMADSHLPGGVHHHDPKSPPAPVELAMVSDDVPTAFARAVEAGAVVVSEPKEQPWGQTVSWVRDPWGVLLEVCSPLA
jgi:predicted enzyme related to lactoylglutathione lyase